MRFKEKTVLVTGGNSGIGLVTARMMIAEGARVAVTGRDSEKLNAAVAELGPQAFGIQIDLENHDALTDLVATLKKEFGTLDVLFANAGISGPSVLGGTTLAAFESIIRTNVTSVFFTVQACIPLMKPGSAIVLNSSVMRNSGMPGTAAYAASKAAVSSMAGVFAAELVSQGIRVNTVVPGGTKTPIWTRGARQGLTVDDAQARLGPAIPMGRLCEPEEVAEAVLFLASEGASGMTGAEIIVDGGMTGSPLASLAPKAVARQ